MRGAEPVDAEKYKAAYQKNLELILKDNNFWTTYLAGQYENKEDVLEVLGQEENLDRVTPEALKEAAGRLLDGKNVIRFVLLPETDSF